MASEVIFLSSDCFCFRLISSVWYSFYLSDVVEVLNPWSCFGLAFEGLQGHWHGGKVVKFWQGEMSWQAGHGWLVVGMDVWLSSQISGKLRSFRRPRVEGTFQYGSCR